MSRQRQTGAGIVADRPAYTRFPARVVRVGDIAIGGQEPIAIQSMTISDTLDVESTIREIIGLVRAGCPLVRVTCPSVREADALADIKKGLREKAVTVPLIADIHFTPNAALRAADFADKVRINPGNYADRKKFAVFEISDAEYKAELERIHDRFKPLVRKLKENGVALRIGSNHGSLSDRILNRYGDTPEGMVESALEFVRICREYDFHDIVLSMKSSVARVAMEANRLLVQRMAAEGMDYPIHLGVTEAGAGLPARLKSAIGIGGLLSEGIGDTIRVSLTEPSVNEIEACREVLLGVARTEPEFVRYLTDDLRQRLGVETRVRPGAPEKRESQVWSMPRPVAFGDRQPVRPLDLGSLPLGGSENVPIRVHYQASNTLDDPDALLHELRTVAAPSPDQEGEAEAFWIRGSPQPSHLRKLKEELRGSPLAGVPLILRTDIANDGLEALREAVPSLHAIALPSSVSADIVSSVAKMVQRRCALLIEVADPPRAIELSGISLGEGLMTIGLVVSGAGLRYKAWKLQQGLRGKGLADRVVLIVEPQGSPTEQALAAGPTLMETGAQALLVGAESSIRDDALGAPITVAYAILQACRLRLTRAEFISCPSCGRTQFDLETTTERIHRRTGHLKGVKIAVMGCIVNGPGEMADADFGYVGSGVQKVDLYKGHTRVRQNLSPDEADESLVQLIKESGRWIDPPDSKEGHGATLTP